MVDELAQDGDRHRGICGLYVKRKMQKIVVSPLLPHFEAISSSTPSICVPRPGRSESKTRGPTSPDANGLGVHPHVA